MSCERPFCFEEFKRRCVFLAKNNVCLKIFKGWHKCTIKKCDDWKKVRKQFKFKTTMEKNYLKNQKNGELEKYAEVMAR